MGMGTRRVKDEPGLASRSPPAYMLPAPEAPAPVVDPAEKNPMYALSNLINSVITIYIWILIASVVLSWLVSFNVVNTGNRVVYEIGSLLHRLTEPLLRPIRSLLPTMGGLDISPVILILALYFVRDLAIEYMRP